MPQQAIHSVALRTAASGRLVNDAARTSRQNHLRRLGLFFSLWVFGATAYGGVVYHAGSTRVSVDGDHIMVEEADTGSARTHDVRISRDRGNSWLLINRTLRTWFRDDDPQLEGKVDGLRGPTSRLFAMPVAGKRVSIDRIKIEEQASTDGGVIAGRQTTRRDLRFSYRMRTNFSGSPLEARVTGTIASWVADGLPTTGQERSVITGVPEIDGRIRSWRTAASPAVLREEMSVSRTITGGQPFDERREFVVLQIEEIEIDAARFAVPEGFEYRLPEWGSPGVTRRGF